MRFLEHLKGSPRLRGAGDATYAQSQAAYPRRSEVNIDLAVSVLKDLYFQRAKLPVVGSSE